MFLPSVRLDTGQVLLDQNNSTIILDVIQPRRTRPKLDNEQFQITLSCRISRLKEVILEHNPLSQAILWRGMVDVVTMMRYQVEGLFHRFPPLDRDEKLRRLVGQALQFIIRKISKTLTGHMTSRHKNISSPFPCVDIILELAKDILGDRLPLVKEDAISYMHLPLSESQIDILKVRSW